MRSFKIILTSLILFSSAHAAVDMANAGYVNLWTDYEFAAEEGYELRVARIYKSRSTYVGLFGAGWCSSFETKLQVTPESSLRVSECGSGQALIYATEKTNLNSVNKSIDAILNKMKESPSFKNLSAANLKKIRLDLYENDERRIALATEYGMIPAVTEKDPYLLNGQQLEKIVWDKNNKYFTRLLMDGRSQRFDEKGRLTHNYDRHGNFLRLIYEKDRLIRVENSHNKTLRFAYGNAAQVTQIQTSGVNINYQYSPQADLLSVEINKEKEKSPQVYVYEYDLTHNMTRAAWPDQTSISVQYDRATDRVKKIVSRDGCSEEFTYRTGGTEAKPSHRSVSVRSCAQQKPMRETYEYWYERAPTGAMSLVRVRMNLGGKNEDISYDAVTGNKKSVKNGEEKLTYQYYEDGQLKSRRSPLLFVQYTYEPGTQNVTSCEQKMYDRTGKLLGTVKTSAKYNGRGLLTEAENSAGQKLKISYDEKSRISAFVNQDQKKFTVEYDDRHGKPSRITVSDLGTVKISYKGTGELGGIQSSEGMAMALRISSSYEKNLNMLNPVQKVLYQ